MGQQELFTLAVAIAGVMIVGRAVARRLEVPDAIVLVVLGVLAGLIPQVPNVDLPPDVVLLLFLPPLVYNAAFLSAPRESRENAIPITGLAFGATAATIIGVGWVTRLVLPGPAFVRNPWRQRLVIGWGGMRGAISLAIVLTLPTMLNGRAFTERPTLVFLAAIVVMATLIGQGLTLGPLLRVLGLAQSERHRRAEASARAKVTEAGLARLDELAETGEVDEDTASVYRQLFEMRLDRVRVALGDASEDDVVDTAGLSRELVRAERDKLAEMYRHGEISDEIRRSISRTLDLQEPRPFG